MGRRIQELERIFAEDPRALVFVDLATALAENGRHARAAHVLRDGLVHNPDAVQARIALARSLFELGDRQAALREIVLVAARSRDDPFVARIANELLEKLGVSSEVKFGERPPAARSARAVAAADRQALIPINGGPVEGAALDVVPALERVTPGRTAEARIAAACQRELRQHLAARPPPRPRRFARHRVALAITAVLLLGTAAAAAYLGVRRASGGDEVREAVESRRATAKPAGKGARRVSATGDPPAKRAAATRAEKRSER